MFFFTIYCVYCVIVTTGRFSYDSYTMKPGDILSRTHACQILYVTISTCFTAHVMKGKILVCYKNLQ